MDEPDVDTLRSHYSQMGEGELLELATESDSLTESARHALNDEFNRRGIAQNQVSEFCRNRKAELAKEIKARKISVRRKKGKKNSIGFFVDPRTVIGGSILVYWSLERILQMPFGVQPKTAHHFAGIMFFALFFVWAMISLVALLKK